MLNLMALSWNHDGIAMELRQHIDGIAAKQYRPLVWLNAASGCATMVHRNCTPARSANSS
jgi:hypothetical protein